MPRVRAAISMSLDGFIAGPNDQIVPMGEGGERLHEWVYDLASWREIHGLAGGESGSSSDLLNEAFANTGAFVMGRRMFDSGEGPWGETPPFRKPVYVVTHQTREPLHKDGGTTFTFVTGGIERALELALGAAGDKDVAISGGANIIQQYVRARLLDELQIDLVPVLLGDGKRLFERTSAEHIELERIRVVESPGVTHLTFRIKK